MNKEIYALLDLFYRVLGSNLDKTRYAFKGGYILGKYTGIDNRSTRDLDMTIASGEDFVIIEEILKPVLNELIVRGVIDSYKFKMPKITDDRNISGGLTVYKKGKGLNNVLKKFKYTGIDISIHPMNVGGVIINPDGFSQYSLERSLGDKVAVLYSDRDTLLRRIRDVYDIYCMVSVTEGNINILKCYEFCKLRKVVIQRKSVLEEILSYNSDVIFSALRDFLCNGERVLEQDISDNKIRRILENVFWLLERLRSVG